MSDPESYEIFAVKYGSMVENRFRRDNFILADDHAAPMPIDYYVWAIRNENRTLVVDAGFDYAEAEKRGRTVDRLPRDGLEMLGIDADAVEDVIITHMHYDHAGTLDDFPAARFHVQDAEMQFATGRHMCQQPFAMAFTCDHVVGMVRRVFEGRVVFHDGDEEIAPGITVHKVGGHTMGMMFVRVLTKRGWVVLASDSTHFYENLEATKPFPIVYSVADMISGYDKIKAHAESGSHIIPGHDPLVLARYPALNSATEGIIGRLDVDPKG
jgi:glyoxylase-like metal-dependent hydrolase (beta-lactamase superfamily II)